MVLEPFKFADNDGEAEEKYAKYKSLDPFPSILPALLNSADIENYVAATGMIHPFDSKSEGRLKPASYRIDIKGNCLYWDENNEKQEIRISDGDEIIIKPNSIVFIGVEPVFRLPDYIALRFNLQITHVYKGLLVGTGPLVDPGFVGKLWLPLHNLTANPYTLKGGDPIIWMEFTKLSPVKSDSKKDLVEKKGHFGEFPPRKTWQELNYYIEKAVGRDKIIRSSIPLAIQKAEISAQRAAEDAREATGKIELAKQTSEDTANQLKEHKTNIAADIKSFSVEINSEIDKLKSQFLFISPLLSGVVAIFLLLITYYNIVYPINTLVQTSTDRINEWGNRYAKIEKQTNDLEKQLANFQLNIVPVKPSGNTSNTNSSSTTNSQIVYKQDLLQLKTEIESEINNGKLNKVSGELKSMEDNMLWTQRVIIVTGIIIVLAQFILAYILFWKKK
jgi:deoxycytidine triphosphate deaminase